jgi:hypothetical protein
MAATKAKSQSQGAKEQSASNQPGESSFGGDEHGVSKGIPSNPLYSYVEQEGDRTAAEKIKAIDKATEKIGTPDPSKSLYELVAGSEKELRQAVAGILELCVRSMGIDHIKEATIGEVLSGEAHLRAALGPTGELPQAVDDAVVPAGMINPTDEILPPNIMAGDAPKGYEKHPGVVAAGEGKSN